MTTTILENDLLLRALRREPVERTPIWVMRQAGRYLPEYRATRKQAGDFLTLCKTPELACEVTLQPIDRFNLDAAILFSDILTIPDAMGLGLSLNEGVGPVFARPLRDASSIKRLAVPDPEQDLGYVMDAVRTVRSALSGRVPLIGFSGSPWTLASYMVEGKGSKEFVHIKGLMFEQPTLLHELLNTVTKSVILYLSAQVQAGAQSLMLFDTWGGMLSTPAYKEFSLQYMARIVSEVKSQHPETPIVLFTKGGGGWLEAMADTGCDGLGLDWTIDMAVAKARVGDRVALQGNMDPVLMSTTAEAVQVGAKQVLSSFCQDGQNTGHVFNLGHGIQPNAKPENMTALVETVRDFCA
ncbi:MAG TPA: uroporphyrinogen decarboxylase [Gammaproteobacteria bacterium]|jgi:uroporphyrinogen decarboxylase|nr:uroporphyrinogen decarboxylase [Gammaproteobacteria bacterium]